MSKLFKRCDILIPVPDIDMEKWSVIACDQHSSEPEYWEELSDFVGSSPSTLRLMLPEAYLDRDITVENEKICGTMHRYLEENVFRCIEDSYILVERTLSSGSVRKGLVGALCLDEYDYSPLSSSPIRATEDTVEERLPARVKIRESAPFEIPHVMVFINDPEDMLFGSLSSDDTLYDFNLNMCGGHIRGSRLNGKSADFADSLLEKLELSVPEGMPVMAIGDGNHSLATAKKCGAKYALVELVNIYDSSIVFEPIHRVLFNTDTSEFEAALLELNLPEIKGYAEKISAAEAFCQGYVAKHGGYVDYIHNDETALAFGTQPNCAALLLPAMDKDELFTGIRDNGVFPKKSFSIGHAADKRYYLECRRI